MVFVKHLVIFLSILKTPAILGQCSQKRRKMGGHTVCQSVAQKIDVQPIGLR